MLMTHVSHASYSQVVVSLVCYMQPISYRSYGKLCSIIFVRFTGVPPTFIMHLKLLSHSEGGSRSEESFRTKIVSKTSMQSKQRAGSAIKTS